jgi:hypothetical protein
MAVQGFSLGENMDGRYILFGHFVLDRIDLRLKKGLDKEIRAGRKRLDPKAIEILVVLISRNGEVVRASELKKVLDYHPDNNQRAASYRKYVSMLRSIPGLSDFLRTVTKARDSQKHEGGYCFEGKVSFTDDPQIFGYRRPRVETPWPRVAPVTTNGFVISLDRSIIDSVGELVFPAEARTNSGYRDLSRRALEDFSFALLYGSQIRSECSKDTARAMAGFTANRLVMLFPDDLYENEFPDHFAREVEPLESATDREQICDYISSMSRALRNRKALALGCDWITREASTKLDTNPTLFGEGGHYDFMWTYYKDGLVDIVPRILGEPLVAKLISFLPRSPDGEPYAANTLREFTIQTVLRHVTHMVSDQKRVERRKHWRMPFAFGSEILRHFRDTQMQHQIRQVVVRHALIAALSELSSTDKRESIIKVLLELRETSPFREIREMLKTLSITILNNGLDRERAAAKLIKEIHKASHSAADQDDPFILKYSSVIRDLPSTERPEYEQKLVAIFPELGP